MTDYDFWILQGTGGPYDDQHFETDPHEQAQIEFHSITSERWKFKVRRAAKRSSERRRKSPAWCRRQRREDINAQVVY